MANIVLNSNYLEYLLSYLQNKGVSHIQALAGVSFLGNEEPDKEYRLPKNINDFDLNIILENATKSLSITAYQLGFELGRGMTSTSHGSLGLALICCNTIKSAIKTYVDYVALVSPVFDVKYHEENGWVTLEGTPSTPISENVYHFLVTFAVGSAIFDNNVFDPNILNLEEKIVIEISKHERIDANFLKPYQNFFIFKFNSPSSRALIPSEIANRQLPMANENTKQKILSLCNKELELTSNSFLDTVKDQIIQDQEFLSLENLANELCMSKRTLHRHLQANGTSYSKLTAEIKMEKATNMLVRTNRSIQAIAQELGFTETTNFSSAFKKYHGLSPKQYRMAKQLAPTEPHA